MRAAIIGALTLLAAMPAEAQTAPAETHQDAAAALPAVSPSVAAPASGPAAPAPTAAQLAAIKYRTELVCKTSIETGSLIAKRKTCLTRKQWAYVNEAHEDEARKLMMDNMGKPSGN